MGDQPEQQLRTAFRQLDKTGTGQIAEHLFRQSLTGLVPDDSKEQNVLQAMLQQSGALQPQAPGAGREASVDVEMFFDYLYDVKGPPASPSTETKDFSMRAVTIGDILA
eukprot:6455360-Amphidinium_carterae.1